MNPLRYVTTLSLAASIVLAFVVGCGSSQTDSTDPEAAASSDDVSTTSPSADTPEAAFTAFSKATKEDDWKTAVTLITDESKKMVVMGMVMQASFMTMEDEAKGKDLEQLFKKHGLDEEMQEAGGPGDEVDVNELVEDLPAFVDDIAAWIAANEDESEGGFPDLGEIREVKTDGDTATGLVKTEMGEQPMQFRKVDGEWKLHLAMGPPPTPSVDELGIDFENTGEGEIGSMRIGEKTSGLNHAFAYNAKFFDEPCIILLLTAAEVSEEKRKELEQGLKEDDGDTMFFATGPNVSLTLSPEGELMSMFAWIDNSSMNANRGPAVDARIEGGRIVGRVGMAPKDFGGNELEFQAKFDTEVRF